MAYIKANLLTEARRQARGEATRVCPEVIAAWALENLKSAAGQAPKGDEVKFLEALYRLEDPREALFVLDCATNPPFVPNLPLFRL